MNINNTSILITKCDQIHNKGEVMNLSKILNQNTHFEVKLDIKLFKIILSYL